MTNERWPWSYMRSGKLGDFFKEDRERFEKPVPGTVSGRFVYGPRMDQIPKEGVPRPWEHMIPHYGSYDEAKKRFYQSLYSGYTWSADAHVHDWRLSGCRAYVDGFRRLGEAAKAATVDFADLEKRVLALTLKDDPDVAEL